MTFPVQGTFLKTSQGLGIYKYTSTASIGDINLRVLTGNIENLSIQGQTEMLSALMQFIKCTNRFSQN